MVEEESKYRNTEFSNTVCILLLRIVFSDFLFISFIVLCDELFQTESDHPYSQSIHYIIQSSKVLEKSIRIISISHILMINVYNKPTILKYCN